MAIAIRFGGKMGSKLAAFAAEACALILDSRHTPGRKASARASLARSLITYCGDGIDRD